MELLLCAGLATVESFLVKRLPGQDTDVVSIRTVITLFLAQYLAVKIYRIFLYPKYFSPLRNVSGPTDGYFFLGQSPNFLKAKTPTELYIKWMREHPDAPFIRYLTWANTEVLVPNSIKAHREVLQLQCYSFSPSQWFLRVAKEVAGRGVIMMDGDEHRAHRKMLTGSFSLGQIRKFEPIFQEKAKVLCRYFDQCIQDNDGAIGVIDCTATFSKIILDIMGSAILGVDLDHVDSGKGKADKSKTLRKDGLDENQTFHGAYNAFFSPSSILGQVLIFANGFVPIRWLPIEVNREYVTAMGWIHEMIRGLIRQRYQDVSARTNEAEYGDKDTKDLVSFIVKESMPDGIAEGIGEDEFLGHLLTFLAAGHETSAIMLSWSAYSLATNPDVQDQLYAEVKELSPNPSFAELDKLPYLEKFCKESLRVYPPSGTYNREANRDVVVEGVHIPKGTPVDLCPAVTSMQPNVWGDDAAKFDPSRWDRLTGDQTSTWAFSSFGNGPRMCLGRQFAMVEIKIILAEIVRNYRFVSADEGFTVESPSFTFRPRGLKVRFQKIRE